MFYLSIAITIVANIIYHVSQKSISQTANPIISVTVSYLIALLISLCLIPFSPPKISLMNDLRELNWATVVVGITIIGIELGFLLVYRTGWNISIASTVCSSTCMILLIFVGLFYFKEQLPLAKIVGIIFCLVGLIMIVRK